MRRVLKIVVSSFALLLFAACTQQGSTPPTMAEAGAPPAEAVRLERTSVVAEGRVVPASSVSLTFPRGGTVAELLIAEGDQVSAGQALARLDDRDARLGVEQARALLEQVKAEYERLLEGATPAQVAAAKAEVSRAEGTFQATRSSVTRADISAAMAELERARTGLTELQAGPRNPELQAAQAAIDLASANLTSQRDILAQAKRDAELRLSLNANNLRNAQDSYSRIYWENRNAVAQSGASLPQVAVDAERAALRAVSDAETLLAQSQLAYEQAQRAEISGIAAAEAQLREAKARYDLLIAPPEADQLAAARSQVALAQAQLDSLTGDERAGTIAAAQAGVAAAEARLEELQAPPTTALLSAAAARVRAAEVSLRQAELALDQTRLVAPISGVVVELNLRVGELLALDRPAIVLADLQRWWIETDDLSELSVVQIQEGDRVAIGFDALPDVSLPGTVTQIKPRGQNLQGDIVYRVIVTPGSWDERLRWNMTALLHIVEQP